MGPRGFFVTAVSTGIVATLVCTVAFKLALGKEFIEVLPDAAIVGVVVGVAWASQYRVTTVSVRVVDRRQFISILTVRMAELGYHPDSVTGTYMSFKPLDQANFSFASLSHNVSASQATLVQFHDGQATVVGPSTVLRELRKLWK